MKKTKKWIVLGAIVFALIAGGCWWFWSLGNVPAAAKEGISFAVDSGTVELERSGTGSWVSAKTGDELNNGDRIRTGMDSAATVRFFGIGESRLAANSELLIQSPTTAKTEFRLSAGRVWTRLLRLLDLDRSFSVRTNAVAATVRGTAFDVQTYEKGSSVWVTDSVVDVVPANAAGDAMPLPVAEGSSAQFDADGRAVAQDAISEDAKHTTWFTENTTRDGAFETNARAAIERDLSSLGGQVPESAGDAIAKLSERLHLAFAGNAAPDLYARYAARRAYRIKQLIDAGKSGLAFQATSRLEENVRNRLSGENGAAYRAPLRESLRALERLFESVDPGSPAYRLRQRIEDLSIFVNQDPDAPQFAISAKLDVVQSELLSADGAIGREDADTARGLLDAATQGSENAMQDIAALPDTSAPDTVVLLENKLTSLQIFAQSLEERLSAVGETVPPEEATSTAETPITTVTTTVAAPPQPAPVITPPSSAPIARIVLAASPNPATLNETVRLTVTGFHADGSTVDLTSLARLEKFGNLGTLNGPTFVSGVAGSVTITATIIDGGKTLTSSVPVTIQQPPPILKSISLVAQSPTTIKAGDLIRFQVIAGYSYGGTFDVTSNARFSLSDPSLGVMNGSTFISNSQRVSTGVERVSATYTENGVTQSASVDVTIQ